MQVLNGCLDGMIWEERKDRTPMKMARMKGLTLSLLLAMVSGATAVAQSYDAWSAPTDGIITPWGAGSAVNLGDEFTSNITGTVTALGIYAGNGSSFAPETVGLYDAAGNLLASATVTDTDPIVDGYYWASASASVVASQSYTVVDQTAGNAWGYLPPPVDHWATYTGSDYLYGSTLADPSPLSTYNEDAYYGGNVAVPEGGSLWLYLILAPATCLGAVFFTSRNRLAARA